MVGSYSPHSDAGGTLHFTSPPHIHHVDPASTFKQLRRSLSRSPSKVPAFRLITSKSTSPTPCSPLSPSRGPQEPPPILSSVLSTPRIPSPSPLASPLASPHLSSARKPRPASRRVSPMRTNSRANSIQRSPRKRTLSESTNAGNVTPRSSASSTEDQENIDRRSTSPVAQSTLGGLLKASAPPLQNSPFPPPRGTTRFEKGYGSWGAKSSPLKRSDGIMNFDQREAGSPSAKRRSLHAGVFGPDFDIFDHEASLGAQDTPMIRAENECEFQNPLDTSPPLPKRTSSLRKTTLQQRHDKPVFAKSKANADLGPELVMPGSSAPKNKFRMSMDSVLPSMPRDSPFSTNGGLPNASAHPLSQHGSKQHAPPSSCNPQRHPLSRTISQSTSNSSVAEDSPTHIPIRQSEHRRPFGDFSKSLPLGSTRPGSQDGGSSSQQSSGGFFATPENYKHVKPLPAAFMSTGLISKRHKYMDEAQPALDASTSTMPDTPCKRHSLAEATSPSAPQPESFAKSHQLRHSFGTPSTPFNPHVARPTPETFGKGVGIFGTGFGASSSQRHLSLSGRRTDGSFQSPPGQADSQSSAEFEIPPTPTKQVLDGKQQIVFEDISRQEHTNTSSQKSPEARTQPPFHNQNSKLVFMNTPSENSNECRWNSVGKLLSVTLTSTGFSTIPRSFTSSRHLRDFKSPAPLSKSCLSFRSLNFEGSQAKIDFDNSASPLGAHIQRLSPHTPRESMIPPDPSGLSISARGEEHTMPPSSAKIDSAFRLPATPTAPRGSMASFKKSNASVTPSHTPATTEFDAILTSRFDKVTLIGVGEFSQVYRVSKAEGLQHTNSYFSLPTSRASPRTPLPDRVWAVKRTRHAYIGPRDRQQKLQEVATLRALGQSDHTLELCDSWEDRNHLYIQTEFCEEGSLDNFLDQVGRQARLDDFRIWKILLEMSLVSFTDCRNLASDVAHLVYRALNISTTQASFI